MNRRPQRSVARAMPASVLVLFAAVFCLSPVAAAQSGTITGSVSYGGKAQSPAIKSGMSSYCAKASPSNPDVVVTDGKLADVHVGIKSGTAGTHAPPKTPVVIDQKGCMYQPRVSGVVAGQALSVTNGDKTMHNVHVYVDKQTWLNRGQPAGSSPIRSDAAEAGDIMTFKCDVHPWMRAFAVVTDHSFFDVTQKSGAFEIKNVPPGRYTLQAWHPTLGTKLKRVTVEAGKTANIELAY